MKKIERKFVNYNAVVSMNERDAEEEPLYCMIAPTAEDAAENRDGETVCSNRS